MNKVKKVSDFLKRKITVFFTANREVENYYLSVTRFFFSSPVVKLLAQDKLRKANI